MIKQTVAVLTVTLVLGCGGEHDQHDADAPTPVATAAGPTPTMYLPGETLFNLNCASCHGVKATGTQQGPPLVHRIYEPSHHADAAFYRAVELGTQAHHWGFGDMSPVEGVSRGDITLIINFVRWLQREAGIT